jgi:hypothetical protein
MTGRRHAGPVTYRNGESPSHRPAGAKRNTMQRRKIKTAAIIFSVAIETR